MLKLYHAPLSPCAQKVRLVLHEKKLPYDGILVDIMKKDNLKPDYLAINPNGVVPTLIDDGATILESSIICEYLDDRFPEISLRPSDPVALSKMRLWAKCVDDKIHPSSGIILFGALVRLNFVNQTSEERATMLAKIPDPARRARQADLLEHGLDSASLADAVGILKKMVDDMEIELSKTSWMLGDRLMLTDFLLAPYVCVVADLGLDGVFEKHPALTKWFTEIKKSAGYIGGIAPWLTPEILAHRQPHLPAIKAKLEPLFA